MKVRTRRAISRVSIAVSFACLGADLLWMHSWLLLIAPLSGILCGVAYLSSTGGRR